jgi:hypothetical protein
MEVEDMEAKRGIRFLVMAVFSLLLVGCAEGSVSIPGAGAATKTRRPSDTPSAPPTETPTATAIPTAAPFVTPSPGPAPELELFNVTIRGYFLFAETRNNTGEAMIFPGRENGLRVNLEQWRLHPAGVYIHDTIEALIQPGTEYRRSMNCLLYPGDGGVVIINLSQICDSKSSVCKGEELNAPPTQLGYQLTGYQGFYKRWEEIKNLYPFNWHPGDLYGKFHPEVRNLVYTIEGNEIIIDFDIEYVIPEYLYTSATEHSWIILYGKNGEIVNILDYETPICATPGCGVSGNYHFYGVGSNSNPMGTKWEKPGVITQWWRPAFMLTEEDLDRVDHIRVLFEIQSKSLCINPIGYE